MKFWTRLLNRQIDHDSADILWDLLFKSLRFSCFSAFKIRQLLGHVSNACSSDAFLLILKWYRQIPSVSRKFHGYIRCPVPLSLHPSYVTYQKMFTCVTVESTFSLSRSDGISACYIQHKKYPRCPPLEFNTELELTAIANTLRTNRVCCCDSRNTPIP